MHLKILNYARSPAGMVLHIRGVHDLKRLIRFFGRRVLVLYQGTTLVGP